MNILIFGKDGQLGKAFRSLFESSTQASDVHIQYVGRSDCDLSQVDAVKQCLIHSKPDLIINAAAYTAVDKAESEPDLAYQINTLAPEVLASMAAELDIPLVHFSTDYVFDGLKKEAYVETDQTNPQSVYGKTKCEGEEKVRTHEKHIILRTSWVFGVHGNNFLKTMLRLFKEKDSLNIVGDQCGSPVSATMLADVTFKIVDTIFKNKNFKDRIGINIWSQEE